MSSEKEAIDSKNMFPPTLTNGNKLINNEKSLNLNQKSEQLKSAGTTTINSMPAGYYENVTQKGKLILPTALWILLIIAGLCFLSLLATLNKTIGTLDTLVEIEQAKARVEKFTINNDKFKHFDNDEIGVLNPNEFGLLRSKVEEKPIYENEIKNFKNINDNFKSFSSLIPTFGRGEGLPLPPPPPALPPMLAADSPIEGTIIIASGELPIGENLPQPQPPPLPLPLPSPLRSRADESPIESILNQIVGNNLIPPPRPLERFVDGFKREQEEGEEQQQQKPLITAKIDKVNININTSSKDKDNKSSSSNDFSDDNLIKKFFSDDNNLASNEFGPTQIEQHSFLIPMPPPQQLSHHLNHNNNHHHHHHHNGPPHLSHHGHIHSLNRESPFSPISSLLFPLDFGTLKKNSLNSQQQFTSIKNNLDDNNNNIDDNKPMFGKPQMSESFVFSLGPKPFLSSFSNDDELNKKDNLMKKKIDPIESIIMGNSNSNSLLPFGFPNLNGKFGNNNKNKEYSVPVNSPYDIILPLEKLLNFDEKQEKQLKKDRILNDNNNNKSNNFKQATEEQLSEMDQDLISSLAQSLLQDKESPFKMNNKNGHNSQGAKKDNDNDESISTIVLINGEPLINSVDNKKSPPSSSSNLIKNEKKNNSVKDLFELFFGSPPSSKLVVKPTNDELINKNILPTNNIIQDNFIISKDSTTSKMPFEQPIINLFDVDNNNEKKTFLPSQESTTNKTTSDSKQKDQMESQQLMDDFFGSMLSLPLFGKEDQPMKVEAQSSGSKETGSSVIFDKTPPPQQQSSSSSSNVDLIFNNNNNSNSKNNKLDFSITTPTLSLTSKDNQQLADIKELVTSGTVTTLPPISAFNLAGNNNVENLIPNNKLEQNIEIPQSIKQIPIEISITQQESGNQNNNQPDGFNIGIQTDTTSSTISPTQMPASIVSNPIINSNTNPPETVLAVVDTSIATKPNITAEVGNNQQKETNSTTSTTPFRAFLKKADDFIEKNINNLRKFLSPSSSSSSS